VLGGSGQSRVIQTPAAQSQQMSKLFNFSTRTARCWPSRAPQPRLKGPEAPLKSPFPSRAKVKSALQAGAISGTADLVVQVSYNKPQSVWDLDLRRTLSFAVFSFMYSGILQVAIYRRFDKWFGVGKSMSVVLPKLAADCFLHAPLVYIPIFYAATGMLQGLSWSRALMKLKDKYAETLKCYVMLWSGPMLICFRYVPLRNRVLFIAGCSFGEKCIYSVIGQR